MLLREQLLSVRPNGKEYPPRLLLYNKRSETDVTGGFGGFLYDLHTEVKKLVQKEHKDVKMVAKTDIQAFDPLL